MNQPVRLWAVMGALSVSMRVSFRGRVSAKSPRAGRHSALRRGIILPARQGERIP